jgi:hypothetical protein
VIVCRLRICQGSAPHHASPSCCDAARARQARDRPLTDREESVVLPFISVHEISDDRIVRWHDYWDLTTLMNTAPQWWIEHIMNGY